MNTKLLIATHNQGKLREYRQIFADLPLDIISLDEAGITWDVAETGVTFEANAQLKAVAYCDATQCLTLADDSGLEVDALNGEPGVYSARYAGPHATPQQRYELLLQKMQQVAPEKRQARFRCVIAIALPDKPIHFVTGICEGEIAFAPRGANGFGYDPVFYLPTHGCTMAELSDEAKHAISHRGQAAERAKHILRQLLNL